jgi:uncharacterized paraquat-inducible protein A
MDGLPVNNPLEGEISKFLDRLTAANVVVQKHGYWINTPPYRASNGNYNKAQECSVCNAYFVSPGNTPYSSHPYCCECGAKMDLDRTVTVELIYGKHNICE